MCLLRRRHRGSLPIRMRRRAIPMRCETMPMRRSAISVHTRRDVPMRGPAVYLRRRVIHERRRTILPQRSSRPTAVCAGRRLLHPRFSLPDAQRSSSSPTPAKLSPPSPPTISTACGGAAGRGDVDALVCSPQNILEKEALPMSTYSRIEWTCSAQVSALPCRARTRLKQRTTTSCRGTLRYFT